MMSHDFKVISHLNLANIFSKKRFFIFYKRSWFNPSGALTIFGLFKYIEKSEKYFLFNKTTNLISIFAKNVQKVS